MKTVIYLKNKSVLSQVINGENVFEYFLWSGFRSNDRVYVDNFEAIFESRNVSEGVEIIILKVV